MWEKPWWAPGLPWVCRAPRHWAGAECLTGRAGEALAHRQAPPHPAHQATTRNTRLRHCTARGREISEPELDTDRGHPPPSPISVQDANRAGAYRQTVTHLPGLIFPRQDFHLESGTKEGQRGKPWLV